MRIRLVAVAVITALLAGACGATPASTAGEPGVTPAGSSTAGSPFGGGVPGGNIVLPSAPPETVATIVLAAEAELELRRRIREDAGIAEALGEGGAAILARSDELEARFGEAGLAELVTTLGLPVTAGSDRLLIASTSLLPPPRATLDDEGWSGSLTGLASFTVSMYLGLTPTMFPNATGDRFLTETQSKNETKDLESDGVKERLTLSQQLTIGRGAGRILMDVTLISSSVLTRASTGAEIARRTATSTGHFEMNGCPTADGLAEGRYKIVHAEVVTQATGGERSGSSSTEGPFTAHDGEDAHLIRTDFAATASAASQGRPGDNGGWSLGGTFPVSIPASGRVTAITVGEGSGETGLNASQENRNGLGMQLLMAGTYLGEAAKEAERFWRSGECIEMKTSKESREVDPGAELSITVTPVHRFDHQDVKARVNATFNGKERLDPTDRPQDPPSDLTFVAGGEEGDRGTVSLEQVGRRGIGKKQLVFTVAISDYKYDSHATAMGGVTGVKCGGLAGDWVIDVSGPGAHGVIKFTMGRDATVAEARFIHTFESDVGSVRWDVRGNVTFVDGDPPLLKVGEMNGTAIVKAQGQRITTPNKVAPFDIALQAGHFCR